MGAEVEVDTLGDEWKGYVFRIAGGNDKQGFPMKQGILTTGTTPKLFYELSQPVTFILSFALQVASVCCSLRDTLATARDVPVRGDASQSVAASLMLTCRFSLSWSLRRANRKFPA